MTVSEDRKLETLNDHYKDTFSHQLNYLKQRNRLFFYLLVVLTLMFFQVVSPSESDTIISKFVSKKIGEDVVLKTSFVRGMLWFALLSLVLRYCQTTVHIERQYIYVHKLEKEVAAFYPNSVAFTREGKSYRKDYPILSDWADILYVWVFPVLLLIFITVKIFTEFPASTDKSELLNRIKESPVWVVSLIFCLMTWVTTIFYIQFRFKLKT